MKRTGLERRQERSLAAPEPLNVETRHAFRREAVDLLEAMRPGQGCLVIDMSRVRNVDSAGVGSLILIERRAAQLRQAIRLRGPSDDLQSLLMLTNLWGLFEVE